MKYEIYPRARTHGLVIQKTGEETLIYDLDADKAVCLNSIAKAVWEKILEPRCTSQYFFAFLLKQIV